MDRKVGGKVVPGDPVKCTTRDYFIFFRSSSDISLAFRRTSSLASESRGFGVDLPQPIRRIAAQATKNPTVDWENDWRAVNLFSITECSTGKMRQQSTEPVRCPRKRATDWANEFSALRASRARESFRYLPGCRMRSRYFRQWFPDRTVRCHHTRASRLLPDGNCPPERRSWRSRHREANLIGWVGGCDCTRFSKQTLPSIPAPLPAILRRQA